MRILRPAAEDEVVAAFLRAEADDQGRYREPIAERLSTDGEPPETVARPDLGDARQNAYRRRLLADLRGFGRDRWMFAGFPPRVDWHRAELTRDDLLEVRYIDDRDSDDRGDQACVLPLHLQHDLPSFSSVRKSSCRGSAG